MIGLCVIQVLRSKGCGKIIAVDLEDSKLDMAAKLGANFTLNPSSDDIEKEVLGMSEGRGADIAFEAVGISETVKTAIEGARKGACVTLVGNLSPTVEIPLQSVVTREIRLQGSCGIAGEFPAVLDMIARKEINTESFLSAEAPLSEGADWFKRLYNKEPGLIKVVLIPGE
jgi:L-iditol 2-dehydrogenase